MYPIHKKILGSILMILGTSIGAGMLALPIVSAHENTLMSIMLLLISWAVSTFGAFSLLEVNLWLESDSNLISMAKATLGKWGQVFIWILYLLLLYSLICAYLASSSDILQALFAAIGLQLPQMITTILALFLLGIIVYQGIAAVDVVNRGLMSLKFLSYFILIIAIAPFIKLPNLMAGDYYWRNEALMVMFTAFGYSIILPSLRGYLNDNKKLLKKVVLIGGLLPLVVYILWVIAVQGLLPRQGTNGLLNVANSSHPNSLLMISLSNVLNNLWIDNVVRLFICVCALTSFLGVSVALTDFIADGLKIQKYGPQGSIVYTVSYLPPLLIVLIAPGIFVTALSYAGVLCVVLLILFPMLMLYQGRKLFPNEEKIIPLGRKSLLGFIFLMIGLVLYQIGLLIRPLA